MCNREAVAFERVRGRTVNNSGQKAVGIKDTVLIPAYGAAYSSISPGKPPRINVRLFIEGLVDGLGLGGWFNTQR